MKREKILGFLQVNKFFIFENESNVEDILYKNRPILYIDRNFNIFKNDKLKLIYEIKLLPNSSQTNVAERRKRLIKIARRFESKEVITENNKKIEKLQRKTNKYIFEGWMNFEKLKYIN